MTGWLISTVGAAKSADAAKTGTTKPIDWNDAPSPRVKKAKPGAKKAGHSKPRRDGDSKVAPPRAEPWKPRKPKTKTKSQGGAGEADNLSRGPKPPVGKPSSKKNRARQLAKAKDPAGATKQRKSPKS